VAAVPGRARGDLNGLPGRLWIEQSPTGDAGQVAQ